MKIAILATLVALCTTGAAAQTLPSGFGIAHVGNPAVIGSATYADRTFSVRGAGTDIWHQSDQFTYAYRRLAGDGVVVARVATLQHVDAWSKAGIMVRESLAPDAKHAFALVTGSQGVAFQHRAVTGGSSTHAAGGAGSAPVWLRLERRGSTVTAARSDDGSRWTTIGSVTISMVTDVYVGLAVTSHHAGALATAAFSHVTMPGFAASGALPEGWTSTLIGAPGVSGTASAIGGEFRVQGLGADIWGTADQFHFVHRRMSGDGVLIARVAGLHHVDPWSKAGVMVRESLAANATHAFALVSGGHGVAYQRRRSTGGPSVHTAGGWGTAPVWVRIERRGSTFTMSRSADGVVWTVVGTDSISMPSTVYVGLAVTSHRLDAAATATFTHVGTGPQSAETQQSAGWTSADIGTPTTAGSTVYDGARFTVRGAGTDIWGTSDQFRFVFQPMTGDVDLIARVSSLHRTDAWAKAGVMLRTSLGANAAHVSVFATPERGLAFQRRTSPGGESLHTSAGAGQAPVWLKLERRGSTVTAFRSDTGTSWSVIGRQTVPFGSTVYAGLAVTSHDPLATTTAVMDQVVVRSVSADSSGNVSAGLNQPPLVSLTSPLASATFTAPASITVSASASDPDGSITRVDFYSGSVLIGSRTTAPFSLTWRDVPAGTYSLVAVARDDGGATTVSGQRIVYVQDPQLPGRAVFVPSRDHATLVTHYRLEVFPASADPRVANPVATQDLGKPPIVNGECTADISRLIAGLPAGTYVALVSAVGAGGSTRSAPSPAFTR